MIKIRSVVMAILALLIVTPYLQMKYTEHIVILQEDVNHTHNALYRNWRNLTLKEKNSLSKLGRILFLQEPLPETPNRSTPYTILVWKHGKSLEMRHINQYTKQRLNPFQSCSVNKCRITYKDDDLPIADLVLFHMHRIKNLHDLPHNKRVQKQIWAFLTDESPYHTFLYSKDNRITDYDGVFNWSMSYRMHSDIPVPYGRTLSKNTPVNIWNYETWQQSKNQTVLVALMASNCGGQSGRWEYVRELQKHMQIDVYGDCGNLKCAGHYDLDCPKLSKYKFYLSFENSNCDEYITEKVWWNAYQKNAIPIVMGGSKESYKKILPPDSYIHVNDFATPRSLADYIRYLNDTASELKIYFQWKKSFSVLNEHGYFQSASVHYCRICEALHYNSKDVKVYTSLESFLDKGRCQPKWSAVVDGGG
ncbi:glycoprotein 3-alpha-L-fucosyltransferase A-like isoform X1 [Photinus pyralis]|uniref:glycoprotein 3-alpha-L-fucosyltransferase A-like isoform X1 n=1 Tax=Photinus pyralis TaxID=7054 RepID=UPI0012672C80|nr:glycoprotein 3-alpha-L-fucosyltransferase A-like isoform X1 [Photinus pyralis]XP_031355595.1 glycoprotein 3-alpha-L-fucosyltransferase A-like isoform X1 [Photinus pyralis]XP_031355596.1 glycoprotein 3-alpha-L-fucosyltransferase A-like isoform X1 [Photinus pyralis]XP_031355597.1 glycoprotein 3-alpha-L-fucosyltransferase A-like isoform X1 [Photinus pyralis]XP_031355598.1 glycoprotein 3-alpha-L-fucosyltransferase A-like isoform X1 [Photinus pyralis]XP_031355599.1 glycoprotein 3-alpha-L-fucosyl